MRQYAILAALSVASLTIAALSGCFRPRNILGRPRLGEREPLTTVWLITAVAAILWIFVPVAYVIFTLPQHIQSPATSPATEPLTAGQLPPIDFTPAETVALSAAGAGAGMIALLLGTLVRRDGFSLVGLSRQRFTSTVVAAVLATIIIVPLVFGASALTESFWQLIHFEHPSEHDLLRILGESNDSIIRWSVILSALLLAPAFEEFLFRGYLQTSLLALFQSRGERERIWPRWAAIVCTSICFAIVHQHLWLMPPIFFLSLCLGYAYERTGNLWVPIAVHAAFNATSLMIFVQTR